MPSNPTPPIWAVLLSAGGGSRLGGVCKGLLEIEGRTLLERQLRAMFEAGVQRCIVVTGFQSDLLVNKLGQAFQYSPDLLRRISPNRAFSDHETSAHDIQHSVRHGLKVLKQEAPKAGVNAILSLVDLPLIQGRHVSELARFAKGAPAPVVIPKSEHGQPGHPIFLSHKGLGSIDPYQSDFSLRQWLRDPAHQSGISYMTTPDPAYFTDLDTVDDLARLADQYRLQVVIPKT